MPLRSHYLIACVAQTLLGVSWRASRSTVNGLYYLFNFVRRENWGGRVEVAVCGVGMRAEEREGGFSFAL